MCSVTRLTLESAYYAPEGARSERSLTFA